MLLFLLFLGRKQMENALRIHQSKRSPSLTLLTLTKSQIMWFDPARVAQTSRACNWPAASFGGGNG